MGKTLIWLLVILMALTPFMQANILANGMSMLLFHVKNAVAVTTEPSAQSTLEPTVEPEPTPEPTTVPPQSIQLPIGP